MNAVYKAYSPRIRRGYNFYGGKGNDSIIIIQNHAIQATLN